MIRRLVAALAVVATAIVLAGCAPAAPAAPAAGDPLANVQVTGEYREAPLVTIGDLSGLGGEMVRTTLIEGTGPEVTSDSYVFARMAVYDGATKQPQVQYQSVGQVFQPSDAKLPPFFAQLFTGVPAGSRVLAVVPGSVLLQAGQSAPPGQATPAPAVIVADVDATPHAAAWGQLQPATQELVSITDGADGSPQVQIAPGATAPTDLVLDVRKLGDGAVVAAGDEVVLQYRGVLFADGQEFDASWSRGAPTSFPTDKVVPGFAQALVGQRVGSQVVAIIPPELAYGATGSGQSVPPNSTLVFVVDLLGIA